MVAVMSLIIAHISALKALMSADIVPLWRYNALIIALISALIAL